MSPFHLLSSLFSYKYLTTSSSDFKHHPCKPACSLMFSSYFFYTIKTPPRECTSSRRRNNHVTTSIHTGLTAHASVNISEYIMSEISSTITGVPVRTYPDICTMQNTGSALPLQSHVPSVLNRPLSA